MTKLLFASCVAPAAPVAAPKPVAAKLAERITKRHDVAVPAGETSIIKLNKLIALERAEEMAAAAEARALAEYNANWSWYNPNSWTQTPVTEMVYNSLPSIPNPLNWFWSTPTT